MNGSAPADFYCERLGAGFWAEPANALTNLAFVLAALAVLPAARRAGDRGALALCAVLALIGAGSFLFHTLAVRWTGLADVLPILGFILVYLWLATRRFLGAPAWAAGLAILAFLPASAGIAGLVRAVVGPVNGSEGYFGVVLVILLHAGLLARRAAATARGLLAGAGMLALSLVARSADQALCPAFPLGTHWLWHLCNAAMLWWMIRVLLRHGRRVARSREAG
jgi:Ceramidase